jgi:alpha-tubulin suppressor-like RCC1 family protein
MKKPKYVTHVAVCRSRSLAVMNDGEVYEWGYLDNDEAKQFEAVYRVPGKCVKVQAGLTFNVFLLKTGEVWL